MDGPQGTADTDSDRAHGVLRRRPVGGWSPRDGQRLIATDTNTSGAAIVSFPFGGGELTEVLAAEPGYERSPASITPDGRTLLFERRSLRDKISDIRTLDLEGPQAPKPLMATPESEGRPMISPSGDLVAYVVYGGAEGALLRLVTFPTPSTPAQVSPIAVRTFGWLSAGEVYWQDPSLKMWSASVSSKNGQLDVGAPKAMFDGRSLDNDVGIVAYDIPRARFLITISESAREEPQLIFVSDWREEAGAAQPRGSRRRGRSRTCGPVARTECVARA